MKPKRTATVQEWIKLVGPTKAKAWLILEGLSTSMADKLARNRYGFTFQDDSVKKIKRAMAVDGFLLEYPDNKAS